MAVSFSGKAMAALSTLVALLGIGNSHAGNDPPPSCVYLIGTVEGQSVAVPGVPVFVPDTEVNVAPLRIYVDPGGLQILGYRAVLPVVEVATSEETIMLPAAQAESAPLAQSIDGLKLDHNRCIAFGITTPAIPLYISIPALKLPGAIRHAPEISLKLPGSGKPVTVKGDVYHIKGNKIAVPGVHATIPSMTAATPPNSIYVYVSEDRILDRARILELR